MASDWIISAQQQLARLQDPHREKKTATVIALVDARLANKSEETVWDRETHPNVCARSVYHGRWKKDDLFVEVLETVTRLAREWNDTEGLRAIKMAVKKLQLATPDAVDQLVGMATTGQVRRVMVGEDGQTQRTVFQPAHANDVRLAAIAVLDRAGIETAVKTAPDDGLRIVMDR
jgi:hypothetical protein